MKRLMALLLMLCIALTGMALAEDELYELCIRIKCCRILTAIRQRSILPA